MDKTNNNSDTINDWENIIEDSNDITTITNSFIYNSNSNNKTIKNNKIIIKEDINEIKDIDINCADDIIILEKLVIIIRDVKNNLYRKFEVNYNTFINWLLIYLEWIEKAILELANRNKQKITNNNNDIIMRNSYKFCEYGYDCKYNYSEKSKCYAQHYVFNLVYSDIYNTINYVKKNKNNKLIDIDNIRITINTTTYVINHMYNELVKLKKMKPEIYNNYMKRKYKFKTKHNKRKKR